MVTKRLQDGSIGKQLAIQIENFVFIHLIPKQTQKPFFDEMEKKRFLSLSRRPTVLSLTIFLMEKLSSIYIFNFLSFGWISVQLTSFNTHVLSYALIFLMSDCLLYLAPLIQVFKLKISPIRPKNEKQLQKGQTISIG